MKNTNLLIISLLVFFLNSCNKKLEDGVLNGPTNKCYVVSSKSVANSSTLTTQGDSTIYSDSVKNLIILNRFNYDKEKLSSIIAYDTTDKVISRFQYFYNNDNQINRVEIDQISDTVFKSGNLFEYDNATGKLSSITVDLNVFNSAINIEAKSKYTYNSKGQLARLDVIGDSNSVFYTIFNYSEAGNLISDTSFNAKPGNASKISLINLYEYDNQPNYSLKFNNYLEPKLKAMLNANNVVKITAYASSASYLPNDSSPALNFDLNKISTITFEYNTDGNGVLKNMTQSIKTEITTKGSSPNDEPISTKFNSKIVTEYTTSCP